MALAITFLTEKAIYF